MTDVELMVIGALTVGPLTWEQLAQFLSAHARPNSDDLERAVESLADKERIVLLNSGRWALIFRT